MKKLLLLLFILNSSVLIAQFSKWYAMSPKIDVEGTWCPYSSKAFDSSTSSSIIEELDFVENPILSSFELSESDFIFNGQIRNHLIGVRGSINNKPILIIDSNMDYSLADEKVIFLPQLQKDEGIPYDLFDFFPSDINYNFDITYEILVANQTHEKKTNVGITVNHYLDKNSGELNYDDRFKVCFNQKLVMNTILDSSKVSIICHDYFPWMSSIHFTVNTKNSGNKKVDIKTPFRVKKGGEKYTIDSLDVINNKVLISKSNVIEKVYLRGESLFSDEIIEIDTFSKGVKVLHFWGSWCVGCLKNFPKLTMIAKQNSDIEFIGICEDRNKELPQKTAEKYGLNWTQFYFNLRDGINHTVLNTLIYPSYLVIKDNILDERFNSIDKLKEYLENL